MPHTMSQTCSQDFGGGWGNWTSEGVKTFYFGLRAMFGEKLDVGRREDPFYLFVFFFLVFTRCLGKNWTLEGVKTFSSGGPSIA